MSADDDVPKTTFDELMDKLAIDTETRNDSLALKIDNTVTTSNLDTFSNDTSSTTNVPKELQCGPVTIKIADLINPQHVTDHHNLLSQTLDELQGSKIQLVPTRDEKNDQDNDEDDKSTKIDAVDEDTKKDETKLFWFDTLPSIETLTVADITDTTFDFTIPPKHIETQSDIPIEKRSVKVYEVDSKDPFFILQNGPELTQLLKSEQQSQVYFALVGIRHLLAANTSNAPIYEMHTIRGLSQLLIWLLDSIDTRIQFEALWSLTNLYSGDIRIGEHLTELGALDKIMTFLNHPNEEILHQSLWAIGNISGDHRDIFLDNDERFNTILEHVQNETIPTNTEVYATLTWLVQNLCRPRYIHDEDQADSSLPRHQQRKQVPINYPKVIQFIPFFIRNLQLKPHELNGETLSDSLWGLHYLLQNETRVNDLIHILFHEYHDLSPLLIQTHLQTKSTSISSPTFKIIDKVCRSGNYNVIQMFLHDGLIPVLYQFLLSNTKRIDTVGICCYILKLASDNNFVEYFLQDESNITNLLCTYFPTTTITPPFRKNIILYGRLLTQAIVKNPTNDTLYMQKFLATGWIQSMIHNHALNRPDFQRLAVSTLQSVLEHGEKKLVSLPIGGVKQDVNLSAMLIERYSGVKMLLGFVDDVPLARHVLLKYFPKQYTEAYPNAINQSNDNDEDDEDDHVDLM